MELTVNSKFIGPLVTLILLPILLIVGTALGSDEYIIPGIVCAAVFLLLVRGVFGQNVHFNAVVISLLVTGYMVGNRGFASLAILPKIYIGELLLAVAMTSLVVRYLLKREHPFEGTIDTKLVLAFLFLGGVRLLFDVGQYEWDALRDSAMCYYALFFLIGSSVATSQPSLKFFCQVLRLAIILQAVVNLILFFDASIFDDLTKLGIPLEQRNDLAVTFSVIGLFMLLLLPGKNSLRVWRGVLIVILLGLITLNISRSSIVALVLAGGFALLAGRREVIGYAGVGLLLGSCGLLVASSYNPGVESSRSAFVAGLKDSYMSIVDTSGTYVYATELGDSKATNNEFRRVLWQTIIAETNADNPLLGKGFGYDFISRFEAVYQAGTWEGLRSAHNIFVTTYGRLGLVGLGLFISIALRLGYLLVIQATMARKRDELPLSFPFHLAAMILLVSGTFGVVLEGPMGAIPFWLFYGIGCRLWGQQVHDTAEHLSLMDRG